MIPLKDTVRSRSFPAVNWLIIIIMNLYPQAGQRRPSVQYIPMPYRSPAREQGKRPGTGGQS